MATGEGQVVSTGRHILGIRIAEEEILDLQDGRRVMIFLDLERKVLNTRETWKIGLIIDMIHA